MKIFFTGEFKGLSPGDNPIGPARGGPQSGVTLLKKFF